jgi:putative toxin-antitoxin system antitoxin component (TIGR02293 family)
MTGAAMTFASEPKVAPPHEGEIERVAVPPARPLSLEQSGRTWKFAEILARATAVFGSQQEAEQWLERPAIGLDQRRPLDLLATQAGVRLVEDFLQRLEYGVYA